MSDCFSYLLVTYELGINSNVDCERHGVQKVDIGKRSQGYDLNLGCVKDQTTKQ